MMRDRNHGVWLAALLGVALVWVPSALAEDKPCGEKGQPSCPLQGWMEKNMRPPMEKKDLEAMAKALKKASEFAPDPSWNDGDKGWKKIALEGAAKAKAGEFKAARKSCKGCHKQWRKKYKAKYRMRPVPK